MKKSLLLFCVSVASGMSPLAAATTFAELQAEVDAAADGDTVYVENDIAVTGALSVGKTVTLASPAGRTNVLLRAASYADAFLNFDSEASRLTLRDVVVDWNKAAGAVTCFAKLTAGSLTFDAGAEIRNCALAGTGSGGISLDTAARLVMNDGAVIRGFEGSSYASAVLIGKGAEFAMNGGLITECRDHTANTSTSGFGGAVYVWGGIFTMHGGTITGNTSDNATAGVVSWSGKWYLSGPSFVTNNVGGGANDAWIHSGWIYFDGDYEGRMTMRGDYEGMPDSPSQWAAYAVNTGAVIGAGLVSSQRDPDRVINIYPANGSLYFSDRCAVVGNGRYQSPSLWDAFTHLRNGETCELRRDVTTSSYVLDGVQVPGLTNVTLRGRADRSVKLARSMDGRWTYLFAISNAVLRVEDLILEGNGMDEASTISLISVGKNGSFILGDGAVIENTANPEQASAIRVNGDGSHLVMEPGSVIRNCVVTNTVSFAAAIRVGFYSNYTVPPLFEMKGGVISNCISRTTCSAQDGYGGAVYVQNSRFVMSGGLITDCSAPDGGVAGVVTWGPRAEVVFTGTARVHDNPGVCPDVYRAEGTLKMEGDFRGFVGISSGSQQYDGAIPVLCAAGSTGAWNFFSSGTDPIGLYRGYNWSKAEFNGNDKAYWGTPAGWIDDAGFSEYERSNMAKYFPSTLDLDADIALPHVFAGTALALDQTVALSFDETAMSARVPLTLVSATNGVFSGTWNFTLPETDTQKGRWIVRPARSSVGVAAYVLDRKKSRLAVSVR